MAGSKGTIKPLDFLKFGHLSEDSNDNDSVSQVVTYMHSLPSGCTHVVRF